VNLLRVARIAPLGGGSPRTQAVDRPYALSPMGGASAASRLDLSLWRYEMKITSLMETRVASVRPEDTLDVAAQRMHDRACGCLPVLDADRRVVGMLTDRDICMAALRTAAPLAGVQVHSAMTAPAYSCREDDSVAEAERLMGQHQVRRLPVVDEEGRLAGLISLDDVAREAWREGGLIVPPVPAEAVGITLGQIARPHLIEDAGSR
jgi:CBS domain-containing protein